MRKYRVLICYTGYAEYEVEAEDGREAYDKAVELDCGAATQISDLMRWKDADTVTDVETGEQVV